MKKLGKQKIALIIAALVFLVVIIAVLVGTTWGLLIGPNGSLIGLAPWTPINAVVILPAALVMFGLHKRNRVAYGAAGILVPLYFLSYLPEIAYQ